MNICFQAIDYGTPQGGGGGIASYVRTMGSALIVQGHKVVVLAPSSNGRASRFQEDGLVVYRIPLGNVHWFLYKIPFLGNWLALAIRELEWGWGFWRQFRRIKTAEAIDILEGSEIGDFFHCLSHSVPLVVRMHGDTYTFRKFSGEKPLLSHKLARGIQRWCFHRADLLTSPSTFQADEIVRECGGSLEISVLPNPIDPYWIKQQEGQQLMRSEGHAVVLYSGRLEYRKGTLVLLRCIRRVLREMPDVEFWIAGGRHNSICEESLMQVIAEEGIGSHLRLLGPIAWDELGRAYHRCDLFVMPSYYETFSISCVEAMACGKAVVATRAAALPEVVDDNRTGILVQPGDPEALARGIIRLLRDPQLREEMGRKGRQKVLDAYDPQRLAAQTIRAYQQILAKKASAP